MNAKTTPTYTQELRTELIACREDLRDIRHVLSHIPLIHNGVSRSLAQIDRRLECLGYMIDGRPW
jgi:hypothetical protein